MKYFYIWVFVPACILIPIIWGVLLYKRFSIAEKIIFYYLVISGICNVTASYLAYASINNLPLVHILTIVEYVLLAVFFMSLFQFSRTIKWMYIVSALFILFAAGNSFFIQPVDTFNTYARSTEAMILITFCIYYFKQQLNKEIVWGEARGFWFVIGLFIYFSSSLTIFILSNISLSLSKQFDWWMWHIHASMVLIMYLLFTKGFIACKK